MGRNLVDELNRSLPATAHAQLGTLLQDLIAKHNTVAAALDVLATAALSPAAVAANTTAEQIFPLAGALVGDVVTVNKPTAQAGLGIVGCRVSSLGNIGITFSNNTAAPINPTAAETYAICLTRTPAAAATLQVTDLVTRGQTAG
jgi:hypothetical protein